MFSLTPINPIDLWLELPVAFCFLKVPGLLEAYYKGRVKAGTFGSFLGIWLGMLPPK
jgi:hypothetical protein